MVKTIGNKTKNIQVTIQRFDPSQEKTPHGQTYEIPIHFNQKNSVLSILQYIYENLDPSLAFTGPCERRLCGACTVIINGKTLLACKTYVSNNMIIEPIKNSVLIRDLVTEHIKK